MFKNPQEMFGVLFCKSKNIRLGHTQKAGKNKRLGIDHTWVSTPFHYCLYILLNTAKFVSLYLK